MCPLRLLALFPSFFVGFRCFGKPGGKPKNRMNRIHIMRKPPDFSYAKIYGLDTGNKKSTGVPTDANSPLFPENIYRGFSTAI